MFSRLRLAVGPIVATAVWIAIRWWAAHRSHH